MATHIVTAAQVSKPSGGDSPYFKPLVQADRDFAIREVSGRYPLWIGTILSKMKGSWTPILDAPQREQALAAVGEIVAALPRPGDPRLTSVSLVTGPAELSILWAYLSRAGPDNDENAARFLCQAAGALATESNGRIAPRWFHPSDSLWQLLLGIPDKATLVFGDNRGLFLLVNSIEV